VLERGAHFVMRSLWQMEASRFAPASSNLGHHRHSAGRSEQALAHYGRSLDAFRILGDERGAALAYHNLGMINADRGQWSEADRWQIMPTRPSAGLCQDGTRRFSHYPEFDKELVKRAEGTSVGSVKDEREQGEGAHAEDEQERYPLCPT
jgi:hypothetical protein